MSKFTYDVQIWKIEQRARKSGTSYRVLWRVSAARFQRSFKTSALADSFRSDLLAAARRGEAFRIADGLPLSKARRTDSKGFFEFACEYMDFKWRNASPGHRRNAAEALATITLVLLKDARGKPCTTELRRAVLRGLNPNTRQQRRAEDHADSWLRANTRPVGDLQDETLVHEVINAIGRNLDGSNAAPSTYRRKRMTLTNALDYAVARNLLPENPLPKLKSTAPSTGKAVRQVDKRAVVNPIQARTLLNAVQDVGDHGDRLRAFFGCMYFAALRPEEAASLAKQHLSLPTEGWGLLHLENAVPEIAPEWTDTQVRVEHRGLKHRERGETRPVPCPPELTSLLRSHMEKYATAPDGRLFPAKRSGGRLGSTVYGRVWRAARRAAFTPEVVASPLARRPYDLRHACVSTWLAAGVPPAKVAEWAGHSVSVLMQVYAKVLDGGDQAARAQIDALLGSPSPGNK